jgi:tetratricopeptide (TPR) repeat protein
MKKILVRVAVGLGFLVLLAIFVLILLRKKTAECRTGQGTTAIEACTFLIKNFPGDAPKFAYLDLRRGHYAVAGAKQAELDDLNSLITMAESGRVPVGDDVKAAIYEKAAEAYAKNADKANALKAADKAIALGSKNGSMYMMRALSLLEGEKYADAIADFKAAETNGYRQLQLYMGLGSAYLNSGDYNGAFAALKAAESKAAAPDDVGLISRQLGLTCFELKLYEQAVAYMTKAQGLTVCPDCPSVIKMSQDFLEKAKRPAKAARKKARRR